MVTSGSGSHKERPVRRWEPGGWSWPFVGIAGAVGAEECSETPASHRRLACVKTAPLQERFNVASCRLCCWEHPRPGLDPKNANGGSWEEVDQPPLMKNLSRKIDFSVYVLKDALCITVNLIFWKVLWSIFGNVIYRSPQKVTGIRVMYTEKKITPVSDSPTLVFMKVKKGRAWFGYFLK